MLPKLTKLSGGVERKFIVSMPPINPTVIEIRIESINVSLKKNLCQFKVLMFILSDLDNLCGRLVFLLTGDVVSAACEFSLECFIVYFTQ